MSIVFTEDDFESFLNDIENSINIKTDIESIENLTKAISNTKENISEKDIINALEQYKRDNIRCILWRAVFRGFLNLNISDDGCEISFVPDKITKG